MIHQWMSNNYTILRNATKAIVTNEADDIFQEVVIQFLSMKTGFTTGLILSGDANKYFMGMYKLNCFSDTSPYQRKYNMNKTVEFFDEYNFEYENSYDVCWRDFEIMLENMEMFFVDKVVYKEYIERKIIKKGFSIKKMANESMIPKGTLNLKFKQIRTELKIEVKKIKDKDE